MRSKRAESAAVRRVRQAGSQGRHVGSVLPAASATQSYSIFRLVVIESSSPVVYSVSRMSASPVARSITQSQSIPSKRLLISDPSQLPLNYSTTPGGTMYSTTPGGTRIVYDRSILMNLRNSPLSKTPPNIPDMPDSIMKVGSKKNNQKNGLRQSPVKKTQPSDDRGEQFEIDI